MELSDGAGLLGRMECRDLSCARPTFCSTPFVQTRRIIRVTRHGWNRCSMGQRPTGVAPEVLASVVRICAHRRMPARSTSLNDAVESCRVVLVQPDAAVILPGKRQRSMLESLCQDCKVTETTAHAAWSAALAIESGCEWLTTDRDYARCKGFAWRSPF